MNDEQIQRIITGLEKEWRMPPVLIEPVRKPFEVTPDNPGAAQILGPREYLPKILCVANFKSFPAVRNEREDYSFLPVVWFQASWALPIDPAVVAEIQKIDWESMAANWTY
jgi:hypothetical protein